MAAARAPSLDTCKSCAEKLRECPKPVPVEFWFAMESPWTSEQRQVARSLVKKWGVSAQGGFMQWGRTDILPEMGTIVPQPHPERHTDLSLKDAMRYAAVLNTLRGRPILLTGGGGEGADWAFLHSVEVVPSRPLLERPNGKPYRGQDGLVVEDPDKPIASASVKVNLIPFPPDIDPHSPLDATWSKGAWTPWAGSWRINALKGLGEREMLDAVGKVEGHDTWEK